MPDLIRHPHTIQKQSHAGLDPASIPKNRYWILFFLTTLLIFTTLMIIIPKFVPQIIPENIFK